MIKDIESIFSDYNSGLITCNELKAQISCLSTEIAFALDNCNYVNDECTKCNAKIDKNEI